MGLAWDSNLIIQGTAWPKDAQSLLKLLSEIKTGSGISHKKDVSLDLLYLPLLSSRHLTFEFHRSNTSCAMRLGWVCC